ncbi:MAG TPA: lysophospholipid acyltransferase family protein, partial [Acidobacteriota bacterium]|nr:lysophospholipid acyltransferase family protein [Acidobacteriota bacterium]
TRDGKLQRFKRGGFTLARKLNVPIVPIAIKGTFELMPAGAWLAKPGKIEMVILPALPPSDDLDATVLEVRKQLLSAGLLEAR